MAQVDEEACARHFETMLSLQPTDTLTFESCYAPVWRLCTEHQKIDRVQEMLVAAIDRFAARRAVPEQALTPIEHQRIHMLVDVCLAYNNLLKGHPSPASPLRSVKQLLTERLGESHAERIANRPPPARRPKRRNADAYDSDS